MKRLLTSAIAVSMLSGLATVAAADGRDHRRDDRGRYEHRDHRHEHRHRGPDRYRYDHRDYYGRHYHHPHYSRYYHEKYYRPHGYRYRVWRRGDRLPSAYRAPRYHVNDYRAYRLRPPPRGYYWVRVDNDVLLTAVATGVVVQVVSGLFY